MEKDIEKYYKNIDKPIINEYVNKYNLKNLLELTTITDLYVFTKKKNNEWKLKEKNKLLKECQMKRKLKIKEVKNTIQDIAKHKSTTIINEVKNKNINILTDIENIDTLIDTIEKDYPTINIHFLEQFSN